MYNKAILIGNVGRDPEVRTTTSGAKVASFSLATTETWRDKSSGERKERTEWHNVVVWSEGLVKVAELYLKKGSRVFVEGKIATRAYTDKDGAERKVTEIVLQGFDAAIRLLDKREGGDSTRHEDRGRGRPSGRLADELDDEVPF